MLIEELSCVEKSTLPQIGDGGNLLSDDTR